MKVAEGSLSGLRNVDNLERFRQVKLYRRNFRRQPRRRNVRESQLRWSESDPSSHRESYVKIPDHTEIEFLRLANWSTNFKLPYTVSLKSLKSSWLSARWQSIQKASPTRMLRTWQFEGASTKEVRLETWDNKPIRSELFSDHLRDS